MQPLLHHMYHSSVDVSGKTPSDFSEYYISDGKAFGLFWRSDGTRKVLEVPFLVHGDIENYVAIKSIARLHFTKHYIA